VCRLLLATALRLLLRRTLALLRARLAARRAKARLLRLRLWLEVRWLLLVCLVLPSFSKLLDSERS
jgi:hypothetical protein